MKIEILASSSKANAYIIEDGNHSILIDCGLPFKQLQRESNFRLSSLEFCLLSHEHKDHSRSIADLLNIGLKCGMSIGTKNALGIDSHYVFNLAIEHIAELYDWIVMPFHTQHDAAEPCGFLIKSPSGFKICFATDTAYLKYRFEGVTHWLIECNYSIDILKDNKELPQSVKDRIIRSHFELENVKEFFKSQDLSQTKEIYLIHLSDDNSDPKRFIDEIQQITGIPVYGTNSASTRM